MAMKICNSNDFIKTLPHKNLAYKARLCKYYQLFSTKVIKNFLLRKIKEEYIQSPINALLFTYHVGKTDSTTRENVLFCQNTHKTKIELHNNAKNTSIEILPGKMAIFNTQSSNLNEDFFSSFGYVINCTNRIVCCHWNFTVDWFFLLDFLEIV